VRRAGGVHAPREGGPAMNRTILIGALALSVTAACGRHSANVEGAANSAPTAEDISGTSFNLRLAGVDKGDYASARLRIQSVQITAGAKVLANVLKTAEVDLAQLDQAWLLASFDAPAGVDDVELMVTFAGATVETG